MLSPVDVTIIVTVAVSDNLPIVYIAGRYRDCTKYGLDVWGNRMGWPGTGWGWNSRNGYGVALTRYETCCF